MTDHNSDTDTQKDAAPQGQGRKLLLDLGPLVLFFATNYITGDFMPVSYTHLRAHET